MTAGEDGTLRLGVDLGGTKIEAAIIDTRGLRISSCRSPSPHSYDHTLAAIRDLADQVEAQCGVEHRSLALGIGTPGSPSLQTGLMRNCNSTHLNNMPLANDLARITDRAVRMANDADCFILSESRDGAGAGATSAFGVILGTGVGGGLTVNGQLLWGPNGIAGEWGHNRLPLERVTALPRTLAGSSRACYCGRRDCVETWLSGPGMTLTHRKLHSEALDSLALHAGTISGSLSDTVHVYQRLLATALSEVINIVDPAVIVLGGGLSNLDSLYEEVPALIAEAVFSDGFTTPVKRAVHGDSSGVRGAAWLW